MHQGVSIYLSGLKTTISEERKNDLTRISKDTLLCWKMLHVEHVKYPSIRLKKGVEIN